MKKDKRISATELLQVLNNQWATTKDVMIIGCIGQNKALQVKRDITDRLEKDGYLLPKNLVPMEKVVEYFKIDLDYLIKVSKLSKGEQ